MPVSEVLVRSLLETFPVLMWSATADGQPRYLNQRCVDYTGRTLKDFFNLGWTDLIHPDDLDETVRAWSHAIQTGGSYHVKHRIRRADGEFRWFHVQGEPLRDSEGRVIQFFGLCVDIDESTKVAEALRQAREKLAQASQIATVAELSASIAHEINQPLQALASHGHACLRWLAATPPNVDEARRSAKRVICDGNAAADVVNHIRALFKYTAPAKIDLDINKLIFQVRALMADEIRRNKVSFETVLAVNLPRINADAVQIQQVIVNLVRNAIEALAATMEHPKLLSIRSRRDGDNVVVDVEDHGMGLADFDRIFEPFVTTKETGMGMGLAICQSIIEAHAGRIWVARNESRGVTFSFCLPIESPVP